MDRYKHNYRRRKQLLLACVAIFASGATLYAQTITSNQTGSQGGYTYEFWKDNGGSGSMTQGSGGAFSVQWNGINNILFRKGLRPGSKSQTITYSANYNPSGNSYLCVYGWTRNPLVGVLHCRKLGLMASTRRNFDGDRKFGWGHV